MSLIALQKRLSGGSPRIYWKEQHYAQLASIYGVTEDAVAKLAAAEAEQAVTLPSAGVKTNGARKAFRFPLSDGSVDRMNDVVRVDGMGSEKLLPKSAGAFEPQREQFADRALNVDWGEWRSPECRGRAGDRGEQLGRARQRL